MSGMGYGMGDDQHAKRKARLAARYGTPAADIVMAVSADPEVADKEEAAAAMLDAVTTAPKKKGGRPKGSKNKRAE